MLKRLREVVYLVPITQRMIEFINDLIIWLENSIIWALNPFIKEQSPGKSLKFKKNTFLIDESAISNDFKITEAGDIFWRGFDKSPTEKLTHCFTNMNTLIEAKFMFGIPKDGKALILYPNAEFYDGIIKGKWDSNFFRWNEEWKWSILQPCILIQVCYRLNKWQDFV